MPTAKRVAQLTIAGAAIAALATGCAAPASSQSSGDAKVDTGGGNPKPALARSADVTEAAKNMRVSIAAKGEGTSDAPENFKAEIAVDLQTKNSSVKFTYPKAAGASASPLFGDGVFEERVIGGTSYLHIPTALASKVGGRQWLKSEGDESDSGFPIPEPAAFLDTLRNVNGAVTELAPAPVRGVQTKHYRADIDIVTLGKALMGQGQSAEDIADTKKQFGSGTVVEDVYVSADNRVQRVVFKATPGADAADKEDGALTSTVDFYDFDKVPASEFAAPPASEVTDENNLNDSFTQLGG
jgi:hypothetical protein